MKFRYSAKTRDGLLTRKAEIEAIDQAAALKALQANDLIVYSILPVSQTFNPWNTFKNIFSISLTDKVRFTQSLADMLIAGLPLTKSLEILIAQSSKPKLVECIQAILNDVESGTPLSASMEKQSDVFSENYTSLVKAGEASGKLADVLQKLGETLEKQRQFRGRVVGALIYPAAIVFVMIAVFALMMIFVVPQMTETYKIFESELPWSTQLIIKISDIFVYYWYYMIAVIIAVLAALKYYHSTPGGKYVFDLVLLKIPLFGFIIKESNIVEFARTLALLSDAGVPIVDGLTIVRNTVTNELFKDSLTNFIEDVKHGYPLSQSVAKEANFPAFVSQMLVVGEETGTVGKRLESISTYYEGEVDKVVKNLSTLIEPVIMVVLGGMVMFLIISIILPIYQLTADFG